MRWSGSVLPIYYTKTCSRMVRHCQPLNLKRIFSSFFSSSTVSSTISSIHQNVRAQRERERTCTAHRCILQRSNWRFLSAVANQQNAKTRGEFMRVYTDNAYKKRIHMACKFPLRVKNKKKRNKQQQLQQRNKIYLYVRLALRAPCGGILQRKIRIRIRIKAK